MAANQGKGWMIIAGLVFLTVATFTGWQLTKHVQASTKRSAPATEMPRFFTEQFARSGQSAARADLMACRNLDAPISQGADLNPAELGVMLNGTWQRRLTMAGVPIPTNSYLYYDISPSGTTGTAMMFDRVNLNGGQAAAQRVADADAHRAFIESIESGQRPGGELLLPSVSSAHWYVTLAPAAGEAKTQGHSGASVQMNGDYFGSGNSFPPGGLNFTEHGTFYKEGNSYVTVRPWISPSTGYDDTYSMDRVVLGPDPQAGIGQQQNLALTYVNCQFQFVDSYVKISSGFPKVNGMTIDEAWAHFKAAGQLDRLPAPFTGKGPEPF